MLAVHSQLTCITPLPSLLFRLLTYLLKPFMQLKTDMDNSSLLLDTINHQFHKDVLELLEKNGLGKTVPHVIEKFWNDEDRKQAQKAVEERKTESPFFKMIMKMYGGDIHHQQTDSHRNFLYKSFQRLRIHFPLVTAEQIEMHDLSKYSYKQTIGYTAKWVHNVDWSDPAWQESLQDHYDREPHHPECHYPLRDQMPEEYLQESVLDMVASRWERQLNGRDDVTNSELVNFDPKFLKRYNRADREKVETYIQRVRNSEN